MSSAEDHTGAQCDDVEGDDYGGGFGGDDYGGGFGGDDSACASTTTDADAAPPQDAVGAVAPKSVELDESKSSGPFQSRFESTVVTNEVPPNCVGVPCCMGIDEAGRGPVLGTVPASQQHFAALTVCLTNGVWTSGAMVYGAAYWPLAQDEEMTKLGFNGTCCINHKIGAPSFVAHATATCSTDSKQLTAAQREGLFEGLKKCGKIGYITISIPPEEISAKMMRRTPYNLNAISHDAAIRMVQSIMDKGVDIAKVCGQDDSTGRAVPPQPYCRAGVCGYRR